jgi:steroid 5-alpha reductase family enzyme
LSVTWLSAAALAVALLMLWAASLRLHDVSIVDLAWGPLFLIVAVVGALSGRCPVRLLLLGLTAIWSLRLFGYLLRRKLRDPGEDRRYRALRERHAEHFRLYSLVAVFLFQGAMAIVVSLPLQFAAERNDTLGPLVVPGTALWLLGLVFETIGDAQLARFKADPQNRGQVMDRGLWRYTRHPNYFGDFCVWWGLWLVALTAGDTWWTFPGPLLMSILLIRVSGAGLLERDIGERRPAYVEYIRRTSGFIPLPPRKQGG